MYRIPDRLIGFIADFCKSQGVAFRADAGETVMFARELEQVRAKIYQVPTAEFKGRRLVPIDNELNAGAEEDTYTWYDSVGQAEFVTNFATTPPRADVFGGQVTHKVRHIWLSYAWNVQELRAAAFARKPLPTMKAAACRKGVEQAIDIGLLLGDSALGLNGLFTLSNTTVYTVPNGVSGSATWALKTPREILADLHAVPRKVYVDTLEIETVDTMVLPTDQYGIISSRLMGDGDSRTILQAFLAASPTITTVETSPKLSSNAAWTGARGVAYKRDPDVLKGIIPLEPVQGAPQWTNLEALTIMEARVGGVQVYRPKAVCYFDGI